MSYILDTSPARTLLLTFALCLVAMLMVMVTLEPRWREDKHSRWIAVLCIVLAAISAYLSNHCQ